MPLNRRGSVRARLSVWFSRCRAARNWSLVGVEHFQAAGVVLRQLRFAADQVQRRPPFGARLGEDQRARSESRTRPGRSCPAAWRPVGFQCNRPAIIRCRIRNRSGSSAKTMRLPSRRRLDDRAAICFRQRRLDAAQQKRIGQADTFELLPLHARPQPFEIDDDIGKFRHDCV